MYPRAAGRSNSPVGGGTRATGLRDAGRARARGGNNSSGAAPARYNIRDQLSVYSSVSASLEGGVGGVHSGMRSKLHTFTHTCDR